MRFSSLAGRNFKFPENHTTKTPHSYQIYVFQGLGYWRAALAALQLIRLESLSHHPGVAVLGDWSLRECLS
jgi:hypothetical protein